MPPDLLDPFSRGFRPTGDLAVDRKCVRDAMANAS